MSQIFSFYILDAATADAMRETTAGRPIAVDPQLITRGPHTGFYVVPTTAYTDEGLEDLRPILDVHQILQLDMEEIFDPPV